MNVKKRLQATCATAFVLAFGFSTASFAHCQIPCGIYGDETRFQILSEHITTIEKSMNEINALSSDPGKNANQITRWVMNKDQHADEMAEIITAYFLQQRIKPEEAETDHMAWMKKVTSCHHILVSAMKAKQTTDLAHVESLKKHLDAFHKAYFGDKKAEAGPARPSEVDINALWQRRDATL